MLGACWDGARRMLEHAAMLLTARKRLTVNSFGSSAMLGGMLERCPLNAEACGVVPGQASDLLKMFNYRQFLLLNQALGRCPTHAGACGAVPGPASDLMKTCNSCQFQLGSHAGGMLGGCPAHAGACGVAAGHASHLFKTAMFLTPW